jgi:hypothetical protein
VAGRQEKRGGAERRGDDPGNYQCLKHESLSPGSERSLPVWSRTADRDMSHVPI